MDKMRFDLVQYIVVEASDAEELAAGKVAAWAVVGKVADKSVGTSVVADSQRLHSISVESLGRTW